MDSLLQEDKPKLNYTGYLIGAVVGIIIIGVAVTALLMRPSNEEQVATILENSVQEGTPEFEALTKNIVIATHRDTVESPNAFGSISMYIKGEMTNRGTRTLTGVEINVSVVDIENNVIKEKRVLAVPAHAPSLAPGETMTVTLSIDGFTAKDDRANIRWRVTAIRAE